MAEMLVNPAVQSYQASKRIRATLTFDGTVNKGRAGDTIGVLSAANDGAGGGIVIVRDMIVRCTTSLTAGVGSVVTMGTGGSVTRFVGATDPTAIDQYFFWHATTPSSDVGVAITAVQNLCFTYQSATGVIAVFPTVADVTAGVLVFDVLYDSVTDGATMIALST